MNQEQNPETKSVDDMPIKPEELLQEHRQLQEEFASLKTQTRKAVSRYRQEKELMPFQAELLQVQRYLEESRRRMIILFEGRDAAGKGGTIRRVTRYMNEKHYRVVALGKPTEEQKTQWYYQKYVSQFPRGARSCCSIAAGTTAPWWSGCSTTATKRNTRISCAAWSDSNATWSDRIPYW